MSRWRAVVGLGVVVAIGATGIAAVPAGAVELRSSQSWAPPARAAGGIDTALRSTEIVDEDAATTEPTAPSPTPSETAATEAPAPSESASPSPVAEEAAEPTEEPAESVEGDGTANRAPAGTVAGAPGLGALPFMQFEQIALSQDTAARVNLGNGNLLLTSADGSLAGPGIGLRNDRFYNGLSTADGTFGGGWSSSLSSRDVRLGTGSPSTSVTFYGPSGFQAVFTASGGIYTAPANFKASLTRNAGAGTYTLTYNSSGEKLLFDAGGTIQWDRDRNSVGNTYSYITGGKVSTVTQASGRSFGFTWNGAGTYVDTVADSAGRTWTYTRNSSNQLTRVDSPAGEWEEYDYDTSGRISQARYPASGGAASKVDFAYDSSSRVTSIKQGTVGSSTYTDQTTFAYAASPKKTTVTDGNSHAAVYSIDTQGRVTDATDALGRMRSQTWTASSDVASRTDAFQSSSAVTTYSYDTIGNASGTALPTGAAASATYLTGTSCGATGGNNYQMRCSTDAAGNGKRYNYDANGNLSSEADSTSGGTGATTASYTYSGIGGASCGGLTGQICTATDGNGHVTSYTYNSSGDLTLVTPPSPQGTTSYGYDSLGRVTSVTDPNGDTTTYGYNQRDQQTQINWVPNSTSFTTSYYPSGLRDTETDSVNGAKTYTWDALGRMTQETGPGYRDVAYTYDAVGNLLTYDETGYSATYGDIDYVYDAANQLTQLTQWGGTCPTTAGSPSNSGCVKFEYDVNGAETKRIFPGNATVNTTRDASGRPTRIQSKNGSGTVVNDIGYSYTATGGDRTNIQTRTSYLEQGIVANAVTSYTYDSLNRLTNATEKNGAATTASWAYGFDNAGNRTSQTRTGTTGATAGVVTYNYDAANRLTSTNNDTTTWTYDAAGNQTRNGITGQTMTYNPRGAVNGINGNQMSAFGAGNASPMSQTAPNITFSTSSAFVGLASSWTNASGATRAFTRTTDGDLIGVQYGAGTKYYYATDALGSVSGMFSSTGAWQGGYSYSPYGEARFTSTATPVTDNTARYIGGYLGTSGLYQLGARFYDPSVGRFTQIDPSGQEANPFSYTAGNPINSKDPTGLLAEELVDLLFLVWDLYQAGEALDAGTSEALASFFVSLTVAAITEAICIGITAGFTAGVGLLLAGIGCGLLGEAVSQVIVR